MPQNRKTGAMADKFGRETSRLIAKNLGAKGISPNSNEFAHEGRHITIRCAHHRTKDVGVPYKMLNRIDAVFAAFEDKEGNYDLYDISPNLFRVYMRDSKGQRKVALVRRSVFLETGRFITHLAKTTILENRKA